MQEHNTMATVLYCIVTEIVSHDGLRGYGIHGYTYSTTNEELNPSAMSKTDFITADGYISKSSITKDTEKDQLPTQVTPVRYYEYYSNCSVQSTPGVEAVVLDTVLEMILNHQNKSVKVLTNDENLSKAINEYIPKWKEMGWKKRDGSQMRNAQYWMAVSEKLDKLHKSGCTFEIRQFLPLVTPTGYEYTQMLSEIGLHMDTPLPLDLSNHKAPDGYWSKDDQKTIYLYQRFMYFNTLASSQITGEYYIGNVSAEKDFIGGRTPDVSYSVVKLNEPMPELEFLRKKQTEMSGDYDCMVVANLGNIYTAEKVLGIKRGILIRERGMDILVREDPTRLDLSFIDGSQITRELRPQKVAFRAMTCLSELKEVLDMYLSKSLSAHYKCIDITHDIYVMTQTGKNKDKTLFKVKDNISAGTGDTLKIKKLELGNIGSINLALGLDTLRKPNFAALDKYNPKVEIILHMRSKKCVRYYCVVTSDLGSIITSNYYSNIVYK